MCDRYPFRLLVKSVSAVSGRDIMVVKLLMSFFLCVFLSVFFVVVVGGGVFDLVFVLFFFCLVVGMLLFLFPVWLRPTSLTSF